MASSFSRLFSKDQQNQQQSQSTNKSGSQTQPNQQQTQPGTNTQTLKSMHQGLGNQSVGKLIQNAVFGKSSKGKSSATPQGPQSTGGSSKTPQPTPEDIRREELHKERDHQAPLIAKSLYHTMITKADNQLHSFLNNDKEAMELRQNIKNAASAAVKTNIDNTENASDEEKADAKRYASKQVERANIVSNLLLKYAKETVQTNIPDTKQGRLETKAKEGFDLVTPNPKTSIEKQKTAAQKSALKIAKAEADTMTQTSVEAIKQQMTKKIKQNAKFLDSSVDVKDLGVKEVEQRHEWNDQLVDNRDIDTVYTNKLYEPLKQAALMKLGVGRRAWRRSKELNQFRQQMKQAGRDEANQQIDSQINTNSLTSNKGTIGKEFYGMMAKVEAYSLAKGSVDTVMEKEAESLVKDAIPAAQTKAKLKVAAKTSAYDIARADIGATKKIRSAAKSGARNEAIVILKDKQTSIVNEARKITKGDKKSATPAPDVAKQEKLKTGIKEQVTSDDIAGKSIKMAVESDSVNSGLAKIGKIIDLTVPNPGDSSSFEFELKVPVHESGAYVLFALGGEAGREYQELAISTEITFGAGFHNFGFDANFRAGFYLESQGKDSKGAMNLISYGMYRKMRLIAPTAADHLWGQGGKSGKQKVEEAELWAAMIEQQELANEDNHIDIGLTSGVQAGIDIGVAEFGGAAGYKLLSRFDKETIERMGIAGFGDSTDLTKLSEKASSLGLGSTRQVFDAGAEANVKLGGNDLSFGVEASASVINWKLREFEATASGSIPFKFGEDAAQWAMITSKIATPIAGVSKNLFSTIQGKIKKEKDLVAKAAGSVSDLGTDTAIAAPFDELGKTLVSQLQENATINETISSWLSAESAMEAVEKIALSSQLDLSIGFSKSWDAQGKSKGWEISVEAAQAKQLEIDAEIVKLGFQKSKRLGKFTFGVGDDGKFTASGGLLGIEKT